MKIGIDCRMYSSKFTGIGRYTFEMVKYFVEKNAADGYPHEFVLFFNQEQHDKYHCTKNTKKVLVNSKHYSLSEQTKFLKILWKENLEMVHFPHFNVPILYRRPYAVTIHDLTLTLFPGQKMTKWYQRAAYQLIIRNSVRTAKKIIAVSENTKRDIITFLNPGKKKLQVIHNGIGPEFTFINDAHKFNNTLKKLGIKKQFLLYTGVWRNHKNLPRLIQAFHILKTKYNTDFQLVMTGNPDPFYPEVLDTIKKFELQDDVITPGLVSEKELIYLYNAAFIYTFPSLYEGFGLPPLESMACGTPVVTSNTSSLPEVCEDNAIYFDPYDTEDMAAKIHKLHTDTRLQAELVSRGLKHVKKFSWKSAAEKTFNAITNV